ncbi:MAG TPA: metal ABC transporter permease, partial [Vampirovibrionales bacterium]
QVQGIAVDLHRYLFVIVLSLTVAISIKAVGILLINAFLVIPAATAKLLTHHFTLFIALSVLLGATSSVVGMLGSGLFNFASGPSIVVVQFSVFLTVLGGSQILNLIGFRRQ